ncbi:MAG: FtsQ-type POTRA domain-containing protein [Acetatifactor sp.]|nr:FtsQ-type POTRA domain-containing protein [Acetatifactor sp.]
MAKRKKGIRIVVILLILAAAVLGLGIYVKNTYTVNKVYVEGNLHYTEDEIKAIVMDGMLGDNSIYLSLKYRDKGIRDVPFVDVIDVEVLEPDTIKIYVVEKMLTGYIKFLDAYMYFDKDGYVVENSSVKTIGVPQITGLEFDHVVVGEPLPVKDEEIFSSILNMTKLLNKYKLISDKIYFAGNGEVTVYFKGVKVVLGNDAFTLEDKIMRLPEFLNSLEGMNGVLQMAVYDENGTYTFQPE